MIATMGSTTQSLMEGSRRSGVCGAVAAIVGGGMRRGLQRRGASSAADLFLAVGLAAARAACGARLSDQNADSAAAQEL